MRAMAPPSFVRPRRAPRNPAEPAATAGDRAWLRTRRVRGLVVAAACMGLLGAAACGRRGSYLPVERRRAPATGASVAAAPELPAPPVPSVSVRTAQPAVPYEVPQPFVARPDEDGAIGIDFGAAALAHPTWVFWRRDWQWAHTEVSLVSEGSEAPAQARGRNEELDLRWTATFRRAEGNSLEVVYDLEAGSDLAPVIGGGFSFKLTDHPAMQGKPVVLPEGEGFAWAARTGGELRVSFSPPLPRVYAERGNVFEIRCLLYADRIERGRRRQVMKVTLPEGGIVRTQAGLPYAPPARDWPVAFDRTAGPDVSFLNRAHGPAGSHGRLRRDHDRLAFADGTPARFWGTNLTAYALFGGSDADVSAVARRLSQLGYNLVRLHHHDSPWVSPNIFAPGPNTKAIDPTSFAALGRWVRALKEQGIYIWIDLHVGRKFGPGDGIRAFEEVDRSDSRGFDYVNPDLEAAERDFARQYLTRKNPHTGLSLAEDPAVVAVLLTNENDLTHHFGNKMLRDKPNPTHTAMFEARAAEFAARTGLPRDRVLRTWEPGPSKLLLNELERQQFVRSRDLLRSLGVNALVATTNTWGNNPTFSLPSLTTGDIIDVHAYGEGEFLSQDPRSTATFVHWIAAAQVADFPLSVTEWNVTWPTKDRFAAPLYVASLGALQGWDMVMQYAYQQDPPGSSPARVDQWAAAHDPALMTQTPAAALLFRRGDVATAKRTYRLELDAATLYGSVVSPETSAAIRTLTEQSRLVIGLPDTPELGWDTLAKPEGQVVVTDPGRSFLVANATQVVSDTGELIRSLLGGYQLIDTPRTQAASGWIGGRTVDLSAVSMALDTGKATVVVTSLDGAPIEASSRLLVTVTAQTTRSAELPLRSEPVTGLLRLRTGCRCARRLRPGAANRAEALPVEDGTVVLALRADPFAHWILLERPGPGSAATCP